MDKWHVTHDYRRLAQRGNLPWPVCVLCDNDLIIGISKNQNDPVWRCLVCNTVTEPSIKTLEYMQHLVDGAPAPEKFRL